jgi:hypothetical protein
MFGKTNDVSPYPYTVVGLFYITALPEGTHRPGDAAGIIVYRAQQAHQSEVFRMYDEINRTVDPCCLLHGSQGAFWPELGSGHYPQRGRIVGITITAPADGRQLAAAMGRVLRYTRAPVEIPAEFVPSLPYALDAIVDLIYCVWSGRRADTPLCQMAMEAWQPKRGGVTVLDERGRVVDWQAALAVQCA